MSLRLAQLPDRTPSKLTILLTPYQLAALNDYADIYEATYGKRASIEQLAPEMLETFLNGDVGFKRARKDLHQQRKEK
ncbi:DUF2274 domain-containing protein [Hyphococcus sp.]|uniref:DUF2274 domain-containing protein n=1 Tax=Hyphococcus sp. TaxID=2038636 RepID=UPI0020828879|nr:MAG: hypothetical protein DHS20C04_08300 [Marinicaulis sp.]